MHNYLYLRLISVVHVTTGTVDDITTAPAAGPVGTVTHNKTPHTRRLSLAAEFWGYADASQLSLFLFIVSRRCGAARFSTPTVLHAVLSFLSSPDLTLRYHAFALSSWLPPLVGTNVCNAVCQLCHLYMKHVALWLL